MNNPTLCSLVRKNDLESVRALIRREAVDMDERDRHGLSALAHAVAAPGIDVGMVQLLLDHGASVDQEVPAFGEKTISILARALGAGDPRKVAALLSFGADLQYQRDGGYDALIDAVHGRDLEKDSNLLALLELLIAKGAPLSGITTYKESGLRVLSRIGRFDAVKLLLRAGADASHLGWTPLIAAVATGTLEDVARLMTLGASLEETDWWERTAWLVSLQAGDVPKASLLREAGANTNARGRCGKPPLLYAVEGHQPATLRWLLELGQDLEQSEDFGTTALIAAVEHEDVECLEILLKAGAEVDRRCNNSTALHQAPSRGIALRLLQAGADPCELSYQGHRMLLKLPEISDEPLIEASPGDFGQGRKPRFGRLNPEPIRDRFWEAMIRSGVSGYEATQHFSGPSSLENGPVWCAQRFGQSLTILPDDRTVQVGGEHEDSYDPDFCIYNDVFVHEPDGTFTIYGYPESHFPPTDFHTATLVGEEIYLIGGLGNFGTRVPGVTPVYRLNTRTFRIERLEVRGEPPGWVYGHRSTLSPPREIRVSGGKIVKRIDNEEAHLPNVRSFILDIGQLQWRCES